jgi:hypothetical protein
MEDNVQYRIDAIKQIVALSKPAVDQFSAGMDEAFKVLQGAVKQPLETYFSETSAARRDYHIAAQISLEKYESVLSKIDQSMRELHHYSRKAWSYALTPLKDAQAKEEGTALHALRKVTGPATEKLHDATRDAAKAFYDRILALETELKVRMDEALKDFEGFEDFAVDLYENATAKSAEMYAHLMDLEEKYKPLDPNHPGTFDLDMD